MAHVNRAFYIIVNAAPQSDEIAKLLYYFKSTYIGLTLDEGARKEKAFGRVHHHQMLLQISPIGIF
jgi:hypothetical protein